MVRQEVLHTRLEKLVEYQKILKGIQKYPLTEFMANPLLHGSAERYLHLSIEAVLDISHHLIRDLKLRSPNDYADSFHILFEAKVISKAFSEKLARMARFRNILVHDYLKLDRKQIHSHLKDHLTDFAHFAKQVKRFL